MVLMGKQSTDGDGNQVGQRLAAELGWPQATFAAKISVSGGSVSVTRETDSGEETLQMNLPAVVTTDLRLNEPRYIALPGIIKARSKPLSKQGRATSRTPQVKLVDVTAPPTRQAGRKVSGAAELVAALQERGAL
jgi:electron transfer flavoprotein beta subunit